MVWLGYLNNYIFKFKYFLIYININNLYVPIIIIKSTTPYPSDPINIYLFKKRIDILSLTYIIYN